MNALDSIPWARRLKMRHFEVFLAIHETGSLTAAATQLHMTQPGLSHWLSELEDVVGRPLFSRNRRFELTREGEVFRLHAVRTLGDVQRTDEELKAVQSGLQGRLHIGSGIPRVLLPKIIARLQYSWPGIFVSVTEAPFAVLVEMLKNRSIDAIIGALGAQALDAAYATEALIPDSIQVVARQGHPCLHEPALRWEDIADYPWILPPRGADMRAIFDAAFSAQHLRPPSPCVEAGSSIRAQLLMGDRDYLSILLGSEAQLYEQLGLMNVPLAPTIRFPDIGVIWNANEGGPIVEHFLEALRVESSISMGEQVRHTA